MILTKPQTKIFDDSTRFRVVVAGRRFGKTFLSTAELLARALAAKNQHVWYVAPTYKAAKEIAWEMLLSQIPPEYLRAKPNESALTMKLLNGSRISLKGAEKPDNLRGRSLDFVVLDEFADMRKEAWFEVIRPSLSDKMGGALFIGTPRGRNHFYDLYTKGVDEDDGWHSYQYTTLQGGNVPRDEVASARADLDERTFQQEYEAQFVNYSGIIYYAFKREESVRKHIDSIDVIHIGMDFNLDPMSAVLMTRKGDTLHIFDEIVMFGSNTDEMVDEIRARYGKARGIIVYPDPASRQRKTSAGGRTDLSILQNAGFEVRVRNSHAAIRDRINAVNARLLSKEGQRRLYVDPKCKKVIESLERHTYKEGTSQPEKDGFDHMNDALGYAVEYLFPIRKAHATVQPQRWT